VLKPTHDALQAWRRAALTEAAAIERYLHGRISLDKLTRELRRAEEQRRAGMTWVAREQTTSQSEAAPH
jgi:hypothetical protein